MLEPLNKSLPDTGSILAIDWGKSRIGLAISDGLQISANPLDILYVKGRSSHQVFSSIQKLIIERDIVGILLGLPVSLDGSIGSSADQIIGIGKKMEQSVQLPIVFEDESFTSVEATEKLSQMNLSKKKKKELVDSMAAVIILEGYLTRSHNRKGIK